MVRQLLLRSSLFVAALFAAASAQAAFDQTHAAWTAVLKKSVTQEFPSSYVDYAALKAQPAELADYLKSLEGVTTGDYEKWSKDERLAFLINAYNAFTLKLVADHYPVKSIREIKEGLLGTPWKVEFFTLLGKKRKLDELEHEMIRKGFSEPRIHFALVCASKGCPALRDEAYLGKKLNAQLEDSAKRFLGDARKNYFTEREKKLYLSSVFEWYGDDFKPAKGVGVRKFVAPRLGKNPAETKAIQSLDTELIFLPWDWTLNDSNAKGASEESE